MLGRAEDILALSLLPEVQEWECRLARAVAAYTATLGPLRPGRRSAMYSARTKERTQAHERDMRSTASDHPLAGGDLSLSWSTQSGKITFTFLPTASPDAVERAIQRIAKLNLAHFL